MTEQTDISTPRETRLATGASLIGSLGAFLGASCCVLPIILFQLGVGSAVIAQLALFARYRQEFLALSLGIIVIAAILLFRARKTVRLRTFLTLGMALMLSGAAYMLPFYEQDLLVLFGFRGG